MKLVLIIFTLLTTLNALSTEKTVHIGTHTFIVVEEEYNEYGDKGHSMLLYAKDANRSKLPQLRVVLWYQSGSCDVKNVEEGHYVFKKDSITTYSHWKRFSNDNAPIGARMQVYKVDDNGSFYVSDSKVYIERTARGEDAYEGMEYLFTKAQTNEEKLLLAGYIKSVEDRFNAKFVKDDEVIALKKEVHHALHLKHQQTWK